ncbi:hypothetical protein PACTADRAFT_31908 [Pachysolen tannophilus NRRL Y-2460]|uniref:Uncharacterized protein n=1 Tax=Pachysolen tannophilus NRRL Y-2460 TaxID=669874 RepID=A0A1E4U3F9_PACTA|nr:hypothetical protein PACTADRAFT_31908 [Pachysolen tannophilus NRRL Y-2460]
MALAKRSSGAIDEGAEREREREQEQEQEPQFSTTALARIFHTVAFENGDTRITNRTLELSAEYLRMFTREAILRANEVRIQESIKNNNKFKVELANNVTNKKEKRPTAADHEDDMNQHSVDEDDDDDDTDRNGGSGQELIGDVLDTRHLQDVSGLLLLDF